MQDFKNPKEIIKAPQNILYTVPINITRSRISFFNEMIKSHLRYEKHKKKQPKVVRSYLSEPQ